MDVPTILALFEKMGQHPWNIFLQPQSTWRERFLRAGFTILEEAEAERILLRPEDNDLGMQRPLMAYRWGSAARRTYCRNNGATRHLRESFAVSAVESPFRSMV